MIGQPSVYLTLVHVTKAPRPSPPYSYAVSDQILEAVGTRQVQLQQLLRRFIGCSTHFARDMYSS